MTYFEQRIAELALRPEALRIRVQNELTGAHQTVQVLNEHAEGISILYPTLDGRLHVYHPTEKKEATYTRLRYAQPPSEGRKYHTPPKAGIRLFLPPQIVEAYQAKQPMPTLVITEGEFKALKATDCGIPTVGVQGIHCIAPRDAEGRYLWPDIRKIVEACGVRNLVLLFDADAHVLREKDLEAGADLFTRLNSFYTAARNFVGVAVELPPMGLYVGHLTTEEKGLDDLLCARPEEVEQVVKDLLGDRKGRFGKDYSRFINVGGDGLGTLQRYFGVRDVNNFYEAFSDVLGQREFCYREGRYQWDEDKGKLEVRLDPESLRYMRIGTKYYKKREDDPNKLTPWSAENLVNDHGKHVLKQLPRYDGFDCFPAHEQYARVVNNFYNTYSRLPFEPAPGPTGKFEEDCEHWLLMLRHLFRGATSRGTSRLELVMDYLQLLYQRPTQKLPIICLVSKLQNTGKSTFPQALRLLFGENVTQCSNQDFESEFNDDYASKLVIYIDEAFIERRIVKERIKRLATEKTIKVNGKGVAKYEQAFHAKFIFCSNNEDSFLNIEDTDNRFWIERVQPLEQDLPGLLHLLADEAPAMLWHLGRRELVHGRAEGRMWFSPELYRTEAFAAAVEASKPALQRAVEDLIRDLLMFNGTSSIKLDAQALMRELQQRGHRQASEQQVRDVLKRHMHLVPSDPVRFDYLGLPDSGGSELIRREGRGRCYLFEASTYLSPAELQRMKESPAPKQAELTPEGQSVPSWVSGDFG